MSFFSGVIFQWYFEWIEFGAGCTCCFFEDWKFYILRFLSHIVNLALDSKQESMGLKKNSGFLFFVGLTN